MNRAILLGPVAANYSHPQQWLESLNIGPEDFLIGIDGGLDVWNSWGILPHLAVGDWDSLTRTDLLQKVLHKTLSCNKDRSDLFYACECAVEVKVKELLCIGVTGGERADHHFAVLCDLMFFSQSQKIKVTAKGEEGDYYFIQAGSQWSATLKEKTTISLFAWGGAAEGVTLEGFQYTLKKAVLVPSSHGLSNEIKESVCSIELEKGQLLVMVPKMSQVPQISRFFGKIQGEKE